jgi:hypothetical protein
LCSCKRPAGEATPRSDDTAVERVRRNSGPLAARLGVPFVDVDEVEDRYYAEGAGHTAFTDRGHLATVRAALADVPHVVLVLPSADRDAALAELRRRCVATKGTDWVRDGHDLLAAWLDDPGTRSLATSTFVTGVRRPSLAAAHLTDLLEERPLRPSDGPGLG